MQRAGTVERIAQGLAIARAADDEPPETGDELVDESLAPAGRVVSVFGPVERPYVAVAPNDRDPATLFDEVLYVR